MALLRREIFEKLSAVPLDQWMKEMNQYLEDTDANSLRVWNELRPYYLLVPIGALTVAVELVMSNLRIELETLQVECQVD